MKMYVFEEEDPTTWPYHVDAHLKWHNYEATTSDA